MLKQKLKRCIINCLLVVLTFYSHQNVAQFRDVEQTTLFQSRINNPVKVEVLERNGEILFTAQNRSFYPYQLTLTFTGMHNLNPMIPKKSFVVRTGYTKLVKFAILDPKRGHSYKYNVSYKMGNPKDEPNLEFIYFTPLRGKIDITEAFYKNSFNCSVRDTVYCTRKGLVTATPIMHHQSDRISNKQSFEVLHEDGTVMVYLNLDPGSVEIQAGQYVYPGQPIGLTSRKNVQLILYRNLSDAGFKTTNIKYCTNSSKSQEFNNDLNGMESNYPAELVVREMSKREQKKYKKNLLF